MFALEPGGSRRVTVATAAVVKVIRKPSHPGRPRWGHRGPAQASFDAERIPKFIRVLVNHRERKSKDQSNGSIDDRPGGKLRKGSDSARDEDLDLGRGNERRKVGLSRGAGVECTGGDAGAGELSFEVRDYVGTARGGAREVLSAGEWNAREERFCAPLFGTKIRWSSGDLLVRKQDNEGKRVRGCGSGEIDVARGEGKAWFSFRPRVGGKNERVKLGEEKFNINEKGAHGRTTQTVTNKYCGKIGGGNINNNNNIGTSNITGHSSNMASETGQSQGHLSPEREKEERSEEKRSDAVRELWPKPRPPVGGTFEEEDDEVFVVDDELRAHVVETSDESSGRDPDEMDDLDSSGFYPTDFRVTGITPLVPGLDVMPRERDPPTVKRASIAQSGPSTSGTEWPTDKPPLPRARSAEHLRDQTRLNSFGDRRTIVRTDDITDDYVRDTIRKTGRPVKVKGIGGGMLAIEFVEQGGDPEEDLREGPRERNDKKSSEERTCEQEEGVELETAGDPWAEVTQERLRDGDDEDMVELEPEAVDGATEDGTGQAGRMAAEEDNRNAGTAAGNVNTSYQTRSKGAPRIGSAKKTNRAASTPKSKGVRGNWEDLAEGDEANPLDQSGRGLNSSRPDRRKEEAQRRKRERGKAQQQNRTREWSSTGTIEEEAACGAEESGTDPQEGPSRQETSENERDQQGGIVNGNLDIRPAVTGNPAGQENGGARPIGSLPMMQQQQQLQQIIPRDERTTQNGGACILAGPVTDGSGPDEDEEHLPPPPSSRTIAGIADAMNAHCVGGGEAFFEPGEEGVEEVEYDFYELEDGLNQTLGDRSGSRVVDVREIVGDQVDLGQGGHVKIAEIVPFIVLKYDPDSDKDWTIPAPDLYQELINRVTCEIMERDLPCGDAYRWATLWGRVGLIGLASKDIAALNAYRKIVEDQMTGRVRFTLYPKDAIEKRANLSILLRENYIGFKVKWLPKAIMLRSRMRGGLRVTHIKTYRDDDKSRNGVSKAGWRLVLLQGCPRFLKDLERFDHEHRFPVGAGHVLIRGGSRRPRGTVGGRAGRRRGEPGSSQQQQQRDQPSRGRGEASRGRGRSRDDEQENEGTYLSLIHI